ncbi:MAG: FAD:protein FMN transferase [Rhodospirillales bacterium]|nr:FAD:protein FMN transferase [Rhodospirillales bacterium]
MTTHPTRRRFIAISAAAVGMAALPAAAAVSPFVWRGVALGARASLTLYHPEAAKAREGAEAAIAEVRRLEKVFSLYQADSALSRLNRLGVLTAPPLDLVRCLDDAIRFGTLTEGAFDVTVQPLWTLYAGHFSRPDADPAGPPPEAIEAARALVDFTGIEADEARIALRRSGMSITLNGIAQGYITDRVAEILRGHGFENVLVDLGEIRALGAKPDGSPWRAGIRDPHGASKPIRAVDLRDRAIATSGGYGTWFDRKKRHHHLFDPKTGRSASYWASVSVIAKDATTSDALSTAFSSMPKNEIDEISGRMDVVVLVERPLPRS